MVDVPIVETLVGFILWVMTAGGLAGLYVLTTIEGFGIPPLPSEVILPFAGYLVFQGTFSAVPTFLVALAGEGTGAFIGYALGRYGRTVLTRGPSFLRLKEEHLAAVDGWFHRHGEGTVFLTRLLPIVRSYASYPAGTARMDPVRFGAYTLAGSAPYIAALLWAGYELGPRWSVIESYFHVLDYVALVAIAALAVYAVLRWTEVLAPGWPPRFTRSSGPPRPEEGGPPSTTGPRSPRA